MMKRSRSLWSSVALIGISGFVSGPLNAMAMSSDAAVRVVGLLQTDYAHFAGNTKRGFDNSFELRRAEVAFKGDFADNWSYQFGLDLKRVTNNSTGSLKDSWVGYSGFDSTFISVGRVGIPPGLSGWGSSAAAMFMERAMMSDVFAPADGPGLYLEYSKSNYSIAGAITSPDVHDNNTRSGDDPIGWGGRVTFAPYHSAGKVLHIGSSYWTQRIKNGTAFGRLSSYAELEGRDTPFVITSVERAQGTVKRTANWGLELAGVHGPWSAQMEAQRYHVYGNGGTADLNFPGYYAQISYVLTGESRSYDVASGTFGSVQPSSPCGAFEVGLRYSVLDLSDRANKETANLQTFISDGVSNSNPQPGETRNWTLGLNWYPTRHVKFQANYVYSTTDYPRQVEALGQRDRNLSMVGARVQVRF